MLLLERYPQNPILKPNTANKWESFAAFNGSIVKGEGVYHFVYRAMAHKAKYKGVELPLSTIGYATSSDRVTFSARKQLIVPEHDWETYGCEDPRVTFFEGKYYIFYTALGSYPFNADHIKIALAITDDFSTIDAKHLITPFNAKAAVLFPERINGKIALMLTVDTDKPPAKIAVAYFDSLEQLWDKTYWDRWYSEIDSHVVGILRSPYDQAEVGANPVKTDEGWLLIYSYIKNYLSAPTIFGIEALLLDTDDVTRVVGRTQSPLLIPEREYEKVGQVTNVAFPTGCLIHDGEIGIYYGSADSTCSLATCKLDSILAEVRHSDYIDVIKSHTSLVFTKYSDNPIIAPKPEVKWESKYTFNPAAIYEDGRVHILYRAQGKDETSVIGYASSGDGVHIDERLTSPIYVPREDFERKAHPGYSGCEDARLTRIGERIYMCYTAFTGEEPTRIALSSILVSDFVAKRWNWAKPKLISPPDMNDKNACVLPDTFGGKYAFFHRIHHAIWIDFVDDLEFDKPTWLYGKAILQARKGRWDSEKVGIGPPPIKTDKGWLLIYHGISSEDKKYRLGACLLDRDDPSIVLSRLDTPVLEPDKDYEENGLRPGTVFSCGYAVIDNQLFLYYGGADQVVCVASAPIETILNLFN